MASIRYPPFWDIEFGKSDTKLNFSHLDFDWEFFYSYVFAKMKDMILEVRLQNVLPAYYMHISLCTCMVRLNDNNNRKTYQGYANQGITLSDHLT